MKILLTGASGFIGTALRKSLAGHGHEVQAIGRHKTSAGVPCWDPEAGIIDLGNFRNFEAVIHLAGDNISSGRWSPEKKNRILQSRVQGTRLLAETLANLEQKPRVMISGSAVGFYGERGDHPVDENDEVGTGFLADVCRQWEAATLPAVQAGIRVVKVRFGMVLSVDGGALKKMLVPFRLGMGGVIGSGKQYMSWVSLADLVEMIRFVLENDAISGPVNLVAPNPLSNRDFTRLLGLMLHRPTILPLPAFAARFIFGEMAEALLLSSTRAIPGKLLDAAYPFLHPHLEAAFREFFDSEGHAKNHTRPK